jgi:hypothetical protein
MKAVITRVAHAGHGEHQYFGQRVLSDLLGNETSTGLVALAIMGRRPTMAEKEVLDAIAVSVTAADPRIWPLKAARLIASYGEMLAGFAAGQLAMMGTYISPRIIGDAAEHLEQLRKALGALGTGQHDAEPVLAEHVAARRQVVGYGVPLRARDERFEALRDFMFSRDRADLPHWQAQEALTQWMLRERQVAPNIGIGLAAALLDIGCSPAQAGALSTFLIEHDFAANAFEAAQQREPLMQKLPEEHVAYVGAAPRVSPRALAARFSIGHDLRDARVGGDMNAVSESRRIEGDLEP